MKNVIIGAGYGYYISDEYIPYADPHPSGTVVDTAPIDTTISYGRSGTAVTPDEKKNTVIDNGLVTEQTIQNTIDTIQNTSNLKEYILLGGIGCLALIVVVEIFKLNNKKK